MQNTNGVRSELSSNEVQTLRNLAEEMCILSQRLYDTALLDDWPEFTRWIRERQVRIDAFDKIYSKTSPDFLNSHHNRDYVAKETMTELSDYLQKVAKVDSEIFDIISEKKDKLKSDMSKVNKGLRFLKSFSRQVNGKRVFSKVY